MVEQPAIALFEQLGWPSANCFYENIGTTNSTLGRETTNDVILWLHGQRNNLKPSEEKRHAALHRFHLLRDEDQAETPFADLLPQLVRPDVRAGLFRDRR